MEWQFNWEKSLKEKSIYWNIVNKLSAKNLNQQKKHLSCYLSVKNVITVVKRRSH